MNISIHHSKEIYKRLEAKKLTESISAYAMEYIMVIMLAIFSIGYHGKTKSIVTSIAPVYPVFCRTIIGMHHRWKSQ